MELTVDLILSIALPSIGVIVLGSSRLMRTIFFETIKHPLSESQIKFRDNRYYVEKLSKVSNKVKPEEGG